MIILHNSLEKDSRAFVATATDGADLTWVNGVVEIGDDIIYDWHFGGREAWINAGNTNKVSAFPSVIHNIPAYKFKFDASSDVVDIAAEQVAQREPKTLADVDDYVSNVNDKIDDTLNPDVVALTKNSTPKEL
jgi:hypothetical protein|tara:strand:- start:59 stop:457 length:399 start_codon:yes stop_codon:yes gene_type:complete